MGPTSAVSASTSTMGSTVALKVLLICVKLTKAQWEGMELKWVKIFLKRITEKFIIISDPIHVYGF